MIETVTTTIKNAVRETGFMHYINIREKFMDLILCVDE